MASETNKIIKKKTEDKELLDQLITQIQADNQKEIKTEPSPTSPPLEITEQVKNKMIDIMDQYMTIKEKLTKINQIVKELKGQSANQLKELETLMRLYGLHELIKGNNKFVLDRTVRKKPLKKVEFKKVLSYVLKDENKVDEIYQTANQMTEEVVVEKIKCLKYKEK